MILLLGAWLWSKPLKPSSVSQMMKSSKIMMQVTLQTQRLSGVAAQRTLTLGHEKCQSKKISNKVAYSVIKYNSSWSVVKVHIALNIFTVLYYLCARWPIMLHYRISLFLSLQRNRRSYHLITPKGSFASPKTKIRDTNWELERGAEKFEHAEYFITVQDEQAPWRILRRNINCYGRIAIFTTTSKQNQTRSNN